MAGPPGLGHKGFFQIGKGAVWGSSVAALTRIPLLSSDIKLDEPPIPDDTITGVRWERSQHQGARRAMGPVTTRLYFEGLLEIFRSAFGAYSNTLVETGVRDHFFKIGPTLNFHTLQDNRGDIPANRCFRTPSAKINRLTLRGTIGQGPEAIAQMEIDWIGTDKESNITPSAGVLIPDMPVKCTQATLVGDGTGDDETDVRVRSFEFSLENFLQDDNWFLSSATIDEPHPAKKLRATFKFTQEFRTKTLYDLFRAKTIGAPSLVFTHPAVIGVGSQREFEIHANQAYLQEDPTPPVNGPETLIHTATWLATFDGVDTAEASPVVCRIRNTEPALA